MFWNTCRPRAAVVVGDAGVGAALRRMKVAKLTMSLEISDAKLWLPEAMPRFV